MPDIHQAVIEENVKTVTLAATPEAISSDTSILFTSAAFYGVKTRNTAVPTNNTTDVWIRSDSSNLASGLRVPAGGSASITAPEGKYFRMSDLYCKVLTAGDGVQWVITK